MTPKEVHVDVIIDSVDPLEFHFETIDLPMGPDNVLYFKNCGHDGFYVHYDLKNPPANFRFPEPPVPDHLGEALYVKVNAQCPTSKSTWGQFKALEVKPGGGTLVVHNKNQSNAQFGYTLRVTNGVKWLDLDPGGFNQNGRQILASAAWTYAAIGVGSALVTTVTLATAVSLAGFDLVCPAG